MISRTQRRALNVLGVAIVAGLMGYALYAEHVLHLEPCPLCVFQRIGMIALGVVFLAAALHAPRGRGARAYGLLGALVTFARSPLYPIYVSRAAAHHADALGDQQVAGLLMWVPAGFVYLGSLTLLFIDWLAPAGTSHGRR